MKVVLQRVKRAAVGVQGRVMAEIGRGVCLLVGIEKGDAEVDAQYLARKIIELRIFPDAEGKMNLSLLDVHGRVLAVSQFTLAASLDKGRRPGFDRAEEPQRAEKVFLNLVNLMREMGAEVKTGVFGAVMEVHLVNDGPVTFILQSRKSSLTSDSEC